jgi:hypothetical protein
MPSARNMIAVQMSDKREGLLIQVLLFNNLDSARHFLLSLLRRPGAARVGLLSTWSNHTVGVLFWGGFICLLTVVTCQPLATLEASGYFSA